MPAPEMAGSASNRSAWCGQRQRARSLLHFIFNPSMAATFLYSSPGQYVTVRIPDDRGQTTMRNYRLVQRAWRRFLSHQCQAGTQRICFDLPASKRQRGHRDRGWTSLWRIFHRSDGATRAPAHAPLGGRRHHAAAEYALERAPEPTRT
jgi:hypothetical protein